MNAKNSQIQIYPGKPDAHSRSPQEKERDLAEISRLYLRGWTHADISAYLTEERNYSIHTRTVTRDLGVIRQRWIESQLLNFGESQARELERADRLIEMLWNEWDRSREDQVSEVSEAVRDINIADGAKGKDGKADEKGSGYMYTREKKVISRANRDGNVGFAKEIRLCIELRMRILGLDAPKQIDINVDWREKAKALGLESAANEQFDRLVREFQPDESAASA